MQFQLRNRLKIIFVTSYIPHPAAGGSAIRSYNLLKQLAARHEIALVAYRGPSDAALDVAPLRNLGIHVHWVELLVGKHQGLIRSKVRALSTLSPYVLQSFRQPDMQRRVREVVTESTPDVIHCDLLRMAWVPEVARWTIPSVLDQHNVEHKRFWSENHLYPARIRQWPFITWEYYRLRRYEELMCKQHAVVTTVTDEDRMRLVSLTKKAARIVTIPVGVDTDYFEANGSRVTKPTLIFAGTMSYYPNEDAVIYFCQDILPQIAAQIPEITLLIVGRNPTGKVSALAQNPRITVVGSVQDVRPYFAQSAICVIPVRTGGGIKQKLLEAMAMGMPVVTNSFSCIGIPVKSDEHVLVRDTSASFAEGVITLLQNPQKRQQLGHAAARFIRQHYSWQQSAILFEKTYGEAIEFHRKSRKR